MNDNTHTHDIIQWHDFIKIEMRVGTIVQVEVFKEAKNPAYKLQIDFGNYGLKKSSAQITTLYKTTDLIGRQVIAVLNFPPKQIATIQSECLVLGVVDEQVHFQDVVLLQPERAVKNGMRVL